MTETTHAETALEAARKLVADSVPTYDELLASLDPIAQAANQAAEDANAEEYERYQAALAKYPEMKDCIFDRRHWTLKLAYERECEELARYASRCRQPQVRMRLFDPHQTSGQRIADFWVNDLVKPVQDQYNWHGQNVSQWNYAGCILVDPRYLDGDKPRPEHVVSTHH